MPHAALFIHGAGQAGPAAWPSQAAEDEPWHFLAREGIADDPHRDARRIVDHLTRIDGAHVVAHSYGANAAIIAAVEAPHLVRSLTLLEPACFDLAREQPAVEEHIAAMAPVFARAVDPATSTREFSTLFAHGMGTQPPDLPDDELEAVVARLRALTPPWGVGLTSPTTNTLVLTGGTRPLYEETASALTRLGAHHEVLRGATHRIQDDSRTTARLTQWFSEQR